MSLGVDAGLRALAHPVRLRILSLLTGAAMTAAEVARELGLTHANASYHIRQLHAAGAIQAAGEEHIRGGLAKRFRYVPEMEAQKRHSDDPVQRRALYAAMAAELRRRSLSLVHTPGRSHMTDAELWVDPDTWADFRARVTEASTMLHQAARPPRTPGAIRVNATIALFEMEADS